MVRCVSCGAEDKYHLEPVPRTSPHYKKRICDECGCSCGFEPKPKNEGKRRRNRHTAESMGIDHCQMCMRPKSRLGDHETLEPHHVIEIQHGGEDIPENIWIVCTFCHKNIHDARKYVNEHMQSFVSPDEMDKLLDNDGVTGESRAALKRLFERCKEYGKSNPYPTTA